MRALTRREIIGLIETWLPSRFLKERKTGRADASIRIRLAQIFRVRMSVCMCVKKLGFSSLRRELKNPTVLNRKSRKGKIYNIISDGFPLK